MLKLRFWYHLKDQVKRVAKCLIARVYFGFYESLVVSDDPTFIRLI